MKIKGVTGWFPANVTLSPARKSRRSDQKRDTHVKKEMDKDYGSRSIGEEEGPKDIVEIVLARG